MNKRAWISWLSCPTIIGAAFLMSHPAIADDSLTGEIEENNQPSITELLQSDSLNPQVNSLERDPMG